MNGMENVFQVQHHVRTARPARQTPRELVIAAAGVRAGELVEEAKGPIVADAVALAAGLLADGSADKGLADTGGADESDQRG